MALTSQHPSYIQLLDDWRLMRDTYAGERAVKFAGIEYLPPTPSMVLDGMKTGQQGLAAYERYKLRAVFWDYVSDAVEALVGMLNQKPAVIKLPPQMEPLRHNASREGETLDQLLRRIHEQQLVYGRLGLLADLPEGVTTAALPYLALYSTISIINWSSSHDNVGKDVTELVVLDESGYELSSDFNWTLKMKYRVLRTNASGIYVAGTFEASGYSESELKILSFRSRDLKIIPFTFVNTKDVIAEPDNPPLLGLARLCLAIYRGEADYRQSLFMQGQDTLVIIGEAPTANSTDIVGLDTAKRVGAGATIEVNLGGDAKYIGVSATGLPEQRTSLENDKMAASTKAGQLVSPQAGKQESGDALTTRISAQTASLMTIARTGAAGLQLALQNIAIWMGLDPETVSVEPNIEFLSRLMTAKDLSDLMDARIKGSPMSLRSIHGNMLVRGMTDLTFEEELKQIVEEQTLKGAQPPIVTPPVAPTKPAQV